MRRLQTREADRRGTLTIWLTIGLFACFACLALAVNSGYLNNVRLDSQRAAEASALAAAQSLLSDEMLIQQRQAFEYDARDEFARMAATAVYEQHRRLSHLPRLNPEHILIGRSLVRDDDAETKSVWTESVALPDTVHLFLSNSRDDDSAGRLMFVGATGIQKGRVMAKASVRLHNRIVGFHPADPTRLPVSPLLIPDSAEDPGAGDWTWEIEQQNGDDEWAWSHERQAVFASADRLPEMTVSVSAEESNRFLFDYDYSRVMTFPADVEPKTQSETQAAFERLVLTPGAVHIFLLKDRLSTNRELQLLRPVVARIMSVTQADDALELVLQPSVLSTPFAMVSADPDAAANPYLWRTQLVP